MRLLLLVLSAALILASVAGATPDRIDFKLRQVGETSRTVTLAWNRQPAADGYEFTLNGVVVSRIFDPLLRSRLPSSGRATATACRSCGAVPTERIVRGALATLTTAELDAVTARAQTEPATSRAQAVERRARNRRRPERTRRARDRNRRCSDPMLVFVGAPAVELQAPSRLPDPDEGDLRLEAPAGNRRLPVPPERRGGLADVQSLDEPSDLLEGLAVRGRPPAPDGRRARQAGQAGARHSRDRGVVSSSSSSRPQQSRSSCATAVRLPRCAANQSSCVSCRRPRRRSRSPGTANSASTASSSSGTVSSCSRTFNRSTTRATFWKGSHYAVELLRVAARQASYAA